MPKPVNRPPKTRTPKPPEMPEPVDRSATLSVFSFHFNRLEIYEPHEQKFPESTTDLCIDFGTTYTYVSMIDDHKKPKLILKEPSGVILTSSQSTPKDDDDPRNAISGLKHLMGRKFTDPFIQNELKSKVPYKIVKGPDGDAWVETTYGKKVSPVYMLAGFLAKVKSNAETSIGKRFNKAVMSCPSVFSDDQFKAVASASMGAGFDHIRSLNELDAAAIAYGLIEKKGLYVIVCIRGGYLCVSVMQVMSKKRYEFKGKGKYDSRVGGEEFIRILNDHLMGKFRRENPSFAITPDFLKSFRQITEHILLELSDDVSETGFVLPPYPPPDWQLPHDGPVSREVHAIVNPSILKELIDGVKRNCESTLVEAGVTASDIDELILVGDMARAPMVQNVVREVFGKMPKEGCNPEEAIALGLASWSCW